MRLDLADLRLFICIREAGSLTGAALQANLALSSVSQRLRHMEEDVGVALFERQARGVSLTPAGQLLEQHALRLLQQHAILKQELAAFVVGTRGLIRVCANTSALTEFLPAYLGPWLKQHPDIQLEVQEHPSTQIIQQLCSGLADVGIVSDAVDAQMLVLEPLCKDHLVLIVPVDHQLIERKAVYVHDILHEQFIGFQGINALQTHITEQVAMLGQQLHFRIRMNSFEGICDMVSNGLGLAIVPAITAVKYQPQFSYHIIDLKDVWCQRRLCVAYAQWHHLSPVTQKFIKDLKTSFAKYP